MKNFIYTFRMLKRNPLLVFVNIPGLAIGLCIFLLLAVYLKFELSFDKHFPNSDNVVRLCNTLYMEEQPNYFSIALRTSYTDLPARVPEVEKAVQMYPGGDNKLKTDKGIFNDLSLYYADAEFFDVFGLKLIEGNTADALLGKDKVVISRSAAEKMFGTTHCLGKSLVISDLPNIVSGVMDDLPKNTHFKFDMLAPLASNKWIVEQGSLEFTTYYLLKEGTDIEKASKNIVMANDELMKVWKERGGLNNIKTETSTERLADIHLYTKTIQDRVPKANPTHLIIVVSIALFVLLIALINFINMYLLHGERRIAEIASRKSVGATSRDLARQFYGETGTIAFLALLVALFLAVLVQPFFAKLIGLPLTASDMFSPAGIAIIVATLVVLVLLSGSYPSYYLSRINLVSGLKGKREKPTHGTFSKAVVLVQFFVTVLLISSVVIIKSQIGYMRNTPLGFNPNNLVCINSFSLGAGKNISGIKSELEKLPFINSIGASQHTMGGGCSGQAIALLNNTNLKPINEYRVMPGFCETMQLELIDGQFFSGDTEGNRRSIVLNESAVRMLGLTFTPGIQVSYKGEPAEVKGIVKDFYADGYAGKKIEPLVLSRFDDFGWNIYLRTNGTFTTEHKQQIAQIIKQYDPEYSMSFVEVGDIYAAKFEKDEQVSTMVSWGALLAIVLSFVGMVALSIMNVAHRTKEIGIRKVVGSTELAIVRKLVGETFVLVGVASLFAFGVSYWLMDYWLGHYATRIVLHIGYFVLSGLLAFAIAFLSVGWQSWRAATRNPVEALRYE